MRASEVKQWIRDAGFAHVGIARAHALTDAEAQFLDAIGEGRHADMHFLERDVHKRFNPTELLPDCHSVIVAALDYRIPEQPASDKYRTARYTWIEDYHVLVKRLLQEVVDKMKSADNHIECRITVDSSCISEKNWAVEAGVGCYGKNGLVHNDDGSYFVFGTILTNCEFDTYDSPKKSDCGDCMLCVNSCPAHALLPYKVDANKCFAYQTVENKNTDNEIFIDAPLVFGCDRCQEVCPKNKKNISQRPNVLKSSLFLRLQNEEMENLSPEDFKTYFGNTALARRKYDRFSRAIHAKKSKSSEYRIADLNEKESIIKYAAEVLQEEAEAVQNLKQYLTDDFVKSVETILHSKGRVIVTGIGKSAIIGQKIVSTLNSTGTPAVFMHAADAIHGDLGIIQPDDVVLCISKSGNTPEISLLTPFLKKNGNILIAMVGNTESLLAREADFVLNCTVAREASPNNLAPTSSSTAQLALGDALASTLIKLRGFTSEDFAKLHPGGILGKRLYMKVKDLYKFNDVPMVAPDDPMQAVILEISGKCLGVTAVVSDNKVVGAITDGDLRRMLERNPDYSGLTAKDVMTKQPKAVHENTLVVDALELMKSKNITNLFVLDYGDRYLGVIHIHDIIKEGIY